MNVEIPVAVLWGIAGYILVTTFGFIWWAATTTEQIKNLKELIGKLSLADGLYARREDVARIIGVLESRQEAIGEKFDKLKEKVDSHGG